MEETKVVVPGRYARRGPREKEDKENRSETLQMGLRDSNMADQWPIYHVVANGASNDE